MVKDKFINVTNNTKLEQLKEAELKKREIQAKINIVKHEKYSKYFNDPEDAEAHELACDKAILLYVKEYFEWGYYSEFN